MAEKQYLNKKIIDSFPELKRAYESSIESTLNTNQRVIMKAAKHQNKHMQMSSREKADYLQINENLMGSRIFISSNQYPMVIEYYLTVPWKNKCSEDFYGQINNSEDKIKTFSNAQRFRHQPGPLQKELLTGELQIEGN